MSETLKRWQLSRLETIIAKVETLETNTPPKTAERLRAAKNELLRALTESSQ